MRSGFSRSPSLLVVSLPEFADNRRSHRVLMKRAPLQRRSLIAALIVALLSSLAPGAGAALSSDNPRIDRDRQAARVTLANTAEVKITAGPTGVLIEWRTSFEIDNLGFNVYRDQGGSRTLVNATMIAGSVLLTGQGTPLYAGYSYRWFDAGGRLDSRYYLEDVDLKGASTITGPYAPVWNESLLRSEQAKTISDVAAAQAEKAEQTGGPAGTFERLAVAPAGVKEQWPIAAQPALKINVKQDGWYRVTQPEMAAAGFDVSADVRNLRLFADSREVPIEVTRSSGVLTTSDFVEFYGTGLDITTTDTHVYYLVNGSQAGLRVPLLGELSPNADAAPSPRLPPGAKSANEEKSVSGAAWFASISSGVTGERDARRDEPSVANQPDAVKVPFAEDSGVQTQPSYAGDREPAASKVKDVPLGVASIKETKTTSAPGRAMSGAARTVQPRKKSRGRRGHGRRRRSAARRKNNHAVAVASPTAGFLYDVQLKERFVYFSALLNGAAENYFGGSLANAPNPPNPPTTKTLRVTNLQTDSQGTALLRIGLQGTTLQIHLVNVLVNDVPVGSMSFDFRQYAEQTFNLPVSQLREGDNIIKFVVAGGSGDHELYSYARLTYPRTFRADNDRLSFALRSTQSAKIDGFTTPNIRVLDISDPASVREVRPIVESAGSAYSATVPATGARAKGSRTFLALRSNSFLQPASLVLNQPSTLNQASNAADLLIISYKDFIPSLAPLKTKRESEGLTVKIVDIEDVFDEFSFGMHTPQAITDLLDLARASWALKPRYLLLVGDASYDYRNYEGGGYFDLVPTRLVDATYLESASDDTLTDYDGDGIPEIPVGRLPVRTVAEANIVISKIVNFLPANVPQGALMVADTQGSYFFNFEQANEELIPLLTPAMQANVQKVYRAQQPSDPAARASIISKINAGTALVNYSGHGNVDVWTGAPIFNNADAMALTNGNKLPLVIVMNCLNGYFVAPPIDCLSEALLKAPNGGAVASFSSSGETIPIGQQAMGLQLFSLLYSGTPIALGDATRQAKLATNDIDVRRTWILFGDPTMKIR